MKNAYDVIVKPIITEQSMEATEDKKYVFQVAVDATKIDIKRAVEQIFGVKVEKVNTINMQGKEKRQGAYPAGRRASWKKAMVKLTPDSKSIEFFEGMV
ncbi:MAG: 50S ribosomal protein L23 [Oscillospiraceae bacterium]|nr:50S ribosomal protein L23 [Oscillospiraceae bacterium]